MNPWTDLTSVVLLGVGRGFAPIQLPGRLNDLLTGSDAEDRLLRAAGVLTITQAAAATAIPSAETAPPPAPPEAATPVTEPELTALLVRIFEEARAPLLVEACRLLAGAARCLPPRLLPRALELGRKSIGLREPLRQALGQRGAWLAGQNPDWNYAVLAGVEPAEQRLWDEGDIDQRVAFLRRLRADDPAEARRLLEAAFPCETARHRALLLPCFGERLGLDDEPFLAATLASDRSKDVRLAAAALLARLPASAFARRMVARLEPCVRSERKLLRTVTVIDPPLSFAPEWKADALEEQPPASVKLGARAWWLSQIVSYAPLDWWEEKLQSTTPADVLALAAKSEWKAALLAGFRAAIRYQPDHAAWMLALLERGGFSPQEAAELALTLEPAAADTALQRLLAATKDAALAARIIEAADFAWSLALWRVAQQRLPRWLAQQDWRFRSALVLLACRIPPAVLSEEMTWPEPSLFADAIADFSHVLEQRRTLYRCLRPSPD
ncbi:MAG: DUF5691 domain-containing protein [Candidatus Competibacteraceae bacterium]